MVNSFGGRMIIECDNCGSKYQIGDGEMEIMLVECPICAKKSEELETQQEDKKPLEHKFERKYKGGKTKWTDDMIEFVKECGQKGLTREEIIEKLNSKFQMNITYSGLVNMCYVKKVKLNIPKAKKSKDMSVIDQIKGRQNKKEEKDKIDKFLEKNWKEMSDEQLREVMGQKFGIWLNKETIKWRRRKLGLVGIQGNKSRISQIKDEPLKLEEEELAEELDD